MIFSKFLLAVVVAVATYANSKNGNIHHVVDQFVGTGIIPEDLFQGTSSILVRLAVALANAGPERQATLIQDFKWEVDMHEYLETANFTSVGHFHLQARSDVSPLVSTVQQMAKVHGRIPVGAEQGAICEYMKSLPVAELVDLYCESVDKFPENALMIAVSERPQFWHHKVTAGGVVFGLGTVDNEIVDWRASNQIFISPGNIFWWFKE